VPVSVGLNPVSAVMAHAYNLLSTAQRLFNSGDYSIAVVVAHIACEVAVERAMAQAYSAKGLNYLEDAVGDLLPGYNLATDRVRKLHTSLTAKDPTTEGYWSGFKASSTRRNKVVHEDSIAPQSEARHTLNGTSALVSYLRWVVLARRTCIVAANR